MFHCSSTVFELPITNVEFTNTTENFNIGLLNRLKFFVEKAFVCKRN